MRRPASDPAPRPRQQVHPAFDESGARSVQRSSATSNRTTARDGGTIACDRVLGALRGTRLLAPQGRFTDPVSLAGAAVALLVPYLQRLGGRMIDKASDLWHPTRAGRTGAGIRRAAEQDRTLGSPLLGPAASSGSRPAQSSPMSSFQISGYSSMNRSMRSMHSGESTTVTSTPAPLSQSTPPWKCRSSPTRTRGMRNCRIRPLQYQQGARGRHHGRATVAQLAAGLAEGVGLPVDRRIVLLHPPVAPPPQELPVGREQCPAHRHAALGQPGPGLVDGDREHPLDRAGIVRHVRAPFTPAGRAGRRHSPPGSAPSPPSRAPAAS